MQKDFSTILQEHFERYPLMQAQDLAKLLYQSEFGPRHMLQDAAQAQAWLQQE